MEVLLVPGGPQSTIEGRWLHWIVEWRREFVPRRWCCPTTLSRYRVSCALIRARGACRFVVVEVGLIFKSNSLGCLEIGFANFCGCFCWGVVVGGGREVLLLAKGLDWKWKKWFEFGLEWRWIAVDRRRSRSGGGGFWLKIHLVALRVDLLLVAAKVWDTNLLGSKD